MPIDPANIGRMFPPTPPYEVGREKIREFAEAIGAEHPAYRDPDVARALGYRDVIAPPTFGIVLTFGANLQVLDEFGVALRDLVHGSQRFTFVRPIQAGDRLTCVISIDDIRATGNTTFYTYRGEVSEVGGERVFTSWCTLVIREPPTG